MSRSESLFEKWIPTAKSDLGPATSSAEGEKILTAHSGDAPVFSSSASSSRLPARFSRDGTIFQTGSKILFQLSGSIAAYKACFVISRLVQQGHEVQCVATRAALEFVGAATLEGLTGKSAFTDIFETGKAMDHIYLSKWADLSIVCPASANTINGLAAGLASEPIGALFLSHDFTKPYLVAPAMNQQMFKHPATQASLAKLESYGVKVLPADEGHQACGDVGPGRLIDPEKILMAIEQALGARS